MSTSEILDKISQLSPAEKLFITERTFKDLFRFNAVRQMTAATEALKNDYKTNQELTAFTSIDLENFYETK